MSEVRILYNVKRYLVPRKEVILNYTELFCKKLLASIVPSKSLDGNFDPQFTHCSISHETPDLERKKEVNTELFHLIAYGVFPFGSEFNRPGLKNGKTNQAQGKKEERPIEYTAAIVLFKRLP